MSLLVQCNAQKHSRQVPLLEVTLCAFLLEATRFSRQTQQYFVDKVGHVVAPRVVLPSIPRRPILIVIAAH